MQRMLTSRLDNPTLLGHMNHYGAVRDLIRLGKLLAERGLIAGSSGNLSLRLDVDQILVTASGSRKGRLEEEDLVVVNTRGELLEGLGKASSELAMHLYVYQRRPDVAACVHAHPPFATAFAAAGVALESNILPEMVIAVGPVPLTQYAPPGTSAVPESLAQYIEAHDAFLLRNHGVLTIGHSLDEAGERMELVEHYAQVLHRARALGGVSPLPDSDVARLERMREKRRRG